MVSRQHSKRSRSSFVSLSLILALSIFGSCDKKKAKDPGESKPVAAGDSRPPIEDTQVISIADDDYVVPPVVKPIEFDDIGGSEEPKDESDRDSQTQVKEQVQAQQQLVTKAVKKTDKIAKDVEEIKDIIAKKRKNLSNKEFDAWRATRGKMMQRHDFPRILKEPSSEIRDKGEEGL
jgi:hypothetical protein